MAVEIQHRTCYDAVRRDDPRFDGQFFTAVLTTGIFCRSVCKSQTPRPENVRFFSTAAAAAESGFRPCLRCRPESAPDRPQWHLVSPVVSQALRLIGEGILDEHGTGELANRLNVSARHLQRLFLDELGTPPISVAQTRRLLFAKKLIDETNLSMTEIAFSAGYSSVRRFNEAIRQTYGRTPTEIRSKRRRALIEPNGSNVALRLFFREPYNWPAMLAFLGEHATPFVEQVHGSTYRRTIRMGENEGIIEVTPLDGVNAVLVKVPASMSRYLLPISERVKQIFDLRADPAAIDGQLVKDPALRPVVESQCGVRVPGVWDSYELMLQALLQRDLGSEQARLALGLIVDWFGDERAEIFGSDLTRLFPRPERLLDESFHEVGLSPRLAGAIREVSGAVVEGSLAFDGSMSTDAIANRLVSIDGADDGLIQYVLMRALTLPDVNATDWLTSAGTGPSARHEVTKTNGSSLSPWRSYAAMYRWCGERVLDGTHSV